MTKFRNYFIGLRARSVGIVGTVVSVGTAIKLAIGAVVVEGFSGAVVELGSFLLVITYPSFAFPVITD